MLNIMLTTVDNPYNPWHDFDGWRAFDEEHGHHTLSLLDRVARTSEESSLADEEQAIEIAINEIIELHANGLYKTISKEDPKFIELDIDEKII